MTYEECECSYRHAKEEEDVQCRSSACSQHPPCSPHPPYLRRLHDAPLGARQDIVDALRTPLLAAAVQLEFESKTCKEFIICECQALSSRRCQHGVQGLGFRAQGLGLGFRD